MKIRNTWAAAGTALVLACAMAPTYGVVLQLDDFSTDTEMWATRDAELAVAQSSFGGGVLSGTFDPASPGDVITDAFRLSPLSSFPGYILTAFSFQVYSANVLASDLVFRFGDGSTTFFRSLSLGSVGGWTTHTLALDNQAGWLGGAPSSFTSVLVSASFYDLQITQNGTNSQTYYVDNFQIMGEEPGYGGSPAAVPEPGTMNLLLLVLLAAVGMRWKRWMRATPAVAMLATLNLVIGTQAESFDADAAGWSAGPAGSMSVAHYAGGHPAGSLRGQFSGQQIAFPQSGSFVAPPSFIAGQFGALQDLRQGMLGFDFKANAVEPVSFRVRIGNGNGRQISRYLGAMISETGRWHSFRLSLASAASGPWDGHLQDFDQIVDDVTTFSIDVSRNGEGSQTYQIDNIFVDFLPDSGSADATGAETHVTWRNLHVGESYRFEASVSLNPALWMEVGTFHATGSVHVTSYIATNDFQFFRLVIP